MGLPYRLFIRPTLKFQDSEKAHHRSLYFLKKLSAFSASRLALSVLYQTRHDLPVVVFGHSYKHPFGLAAGMDKKAEVLLGWQAIGLSFAEIGGVTMLEQSGNPKPRMFRSDKHQALINRMGFNNPGSEKISQTLGLHFKKHGHLNIPIWVNLGKSKLTDNSEAHIDYSTTMDKLWDYGDVFVINVSSPNTPNLRDLQNQDELSKIIASCVKVNQNNCQTKNLPAKPILVKVAPDMSHEQLELIVKTAIDSGCSGIVATNTTVSRVVTSDAKDAKIMAENGGMSGLPLVDKSTEFIRLIYRITDGKFPIVGVGGIMNAEHAWQKITAGASLLQAYSAFVFQGPSISKDIVRGLKKKLREHNFTSIEQAIGLDHKGDD